MYNPNIALPWIPNTLPYSLPENVPLVAVIKDKEIPVVITVLNSKAEMVVDCSLLGYGFCVDIDLCDIISYIQICVRS